MSHQENNDKVKRNIQRNLSLSSVKNGNHKNNVSSDNGNKSFSKSTSLSKINKTVNKLILPKIQGKIPPLPGRPPKPPLFKAPTHKESFTGNNSIIMTTNTENAILNKETNIKPVPSPQIGAWEVDETYEDSDIMDKIINGSLMKEDIKEMYILLYYYFAN